MGFIEELSKVEENVGEGSSKELEFGLLDVGNSGRIKLVPKRQDPTDIYRVVSDHPIGFAPPVTRDEILKDLEEKYLKPKKVMNDKWLSKCQEYWFKPSEYTNLLLSEPSKPATKIDFVRDPLSDQINGYEETAIPESALTASNSTSLQREPGVMNDFVRGRAGNFPFAPGGLEYDIMAETVEDIAKGIEKSLSLHEDEILSIPPGFDRGLALEEGKEYNQSVPNSLCIENIFDDDDFDIDQYLNEVPVSEVIEEEAKEEKLSESKDSLEKSIDDLLPERAPPILMAPRQGPAISRNKEWAHVVDINTDLSNFDELVPELAHEYPFELDTFQKQAVYHLENGDSVFVAAHTSAGKTVVAEYAIALATKHMTRAIYTSPIKALSNQKFRDFKNTFDDVGILTGDIQINPEASCLIMTTEILRSMLYRGADLIRDVEFVIFDEVHYVNDSERGVVWEEVIIMLPAHVSLILLSATVPNTKEFADWVGRTKKRDIYVISTPKRPVPLEHYLFAEKEIFKIVDAKKNFSTVGWKNANDALTGIKAKEKAKPGRGGATAGRQTSYRAMEKQDRNLWIHLVGLLKKKSLLPVVVFTFSKKKCEEYASGLTNTDLTSATEKSEIHVFIERSLVRLKGTDKELPQVMKVRDLLSRGIAVHHGGLLPIIKEMVEILFARNLVKVLFATETFAMGVNMPARTVVFSGIRKHDGKSFRELLPGEYTQMSGRAGRRGLDSTGVVIIACGGDAAPETAVLNKMILGQPTKLESQFRLTYNMILNLLRVEALKVEEMIKRSFSENASQKQLPERQKAFAESEKSLNSLEKLDCTICVPDIYNYYDTSSRILELSHQLMAKIANLPIGMKASSPGRIIILNNRFYRNSPAVILRNATSGTTIRSSNERFLWCLILTDKNHEVLETDEDYSEGIAPLPVTRVALPDATSYAHRIEAISFSDIAIITRNSLKLDPEAILDRVNDVEISRVTQELFKYAEEANSSTILEYDWSKIRELEFQEQSKEKDILFSKLDKFQCIRCPDMSEHYTMVHGERLLKAKVTELQHIISDQNLELLPDYHQRIEVLKELKFIDENCTVSLKGRLGCEINSADELIVTELILDNILAEFEPAEIVALLSCFVFQEKNSSPPSLTPRLEKGQKIILDIATRVAETQEKCGLNVRAEDYIHTLKFGLSEVVYEWAKGMSFKQITDLTDVQEGSIVRCITRLDETCREVRNAARMVGDSNLYQKMEEAASLIKRDIVFAASLYF